MTRTGVSCPGSSPLARGLHLRHPGNGVDVRIIPARAGFTRRRSSTSSSRRDHPRSRGVYDVTFRPYHYRTGSSPLARGLRDRMAHRGRPRRIIPARAGFTEQRSTPVRCPWDHPRSRGVYTSAAWAQDLDAGSSPLARGLPLDAARGLPHSGIIPARAGFTAGHPHGDETTPDHPRSRGVYADDNSAFGNLAGSSPLARGLRGAHSLQESVGRIIPARAGFTSPRRRGSGRSPDHPRSRGVYGRKGRPPRSLVGSSPLARGLPLLGRRRRRAQGIIPARAGFTR